jgi:hypothetical protein
MKRVFATVAKPRVDRLERQTTCIHLYFFQIFQSVIKVADADFLISAIPILSIVTGDSKTLSGVLEADNLIK